MITSAREAGQCHNDMVGQSSDVQLRIDLLPINMAVMLRVEGWRRLIRPRDGREFVNATLRDWVLGPAWPGLGLPSWAMLYALLDMNPTYGPECRTLLQAQGAPMPPEPTVNQAVATMIARYGRSAVVKVIEEEMSTLPPSR